MCSTEEGLAYCVFEKKHLDEKISEPSTKLKNLKKID